MRHPYKLDPAVLIFGRVARRKGKEKVIAIENLDQAHQLRILKVELKGLNRPSRYVKLQVEEPEPGRQLRLRARVVPNAPKGAFRGRIVLTLNHPRSPRQVVNFSAYVR